MARRKSRSLDRNYPSLLQALGHGIANNLTLILALAFLVGINLTLNRLGETLRQAADVAPAERPPAESPTGPTPGDTSGDTSGEPGVSEETWEAIRHHERCTHREYREKYYFACFPDGTSVYDRPEMESGAGNSV